VIPKKPSYANGFAPRDFEPLYPSLWQGCRLAVAACLGPSDRSQVVDWSQRVGKLPIVSPPTGGLVQLDKGEYAYKFDGTSYIGGTVPSPLKTFPVAFSCWFRQTTGIVGDGTEDYTLMGMGDSADDNNYFFLSLYRTSSRGTCFRSLCSGLGGLHTEGYFTHDTNWHHIAYVWYTGSFALAYLDGRIISLSTVAGSNSSPANINTYGIQALSRPSIHGRSANMLMDDARIYDRILRPQEIRILARRRGIAYEGVARRIGVVGPPSPDATVNLEGVESTGAVGTVTIGGDAASPTLGKVLVVGGGGAAPGYRAGGGGGGGVLYDDAYALTAGSHSVTVGAGGTACGGLDSTNTGGSDSVFGTLTALGGGRGGGGGSNQVGGDGGCGGGRGAPGGSSTSLIPGGTGTQGGNGGGAIAAPRRNAGGGGGAGGNGEDAEGTSGGGVGSAGDGGPGISNSITGSAVYYAGGGGGAISATPGVVGVGGVGGGGTACGAGGTDCTGGSGTANTGGGGGGGFSTGSFTGFGGAGGSGVVIISYPTASFVHAGGNATGSDGAGNTWVQFNSSGTLTLVPAALAGKVLVVGGGGGAAGLWAGGGGGGGVVYDPIYPLSVGSHSVTVGAGGAGSSVFSSANANGSNSVFGSLTALGGGRGGGGNGAGQFAGGNGGCGGGTGSIGVADPSAGGTGSQGGNGGAANSPVSGSSNGGGGGGAGGNGVAGTSSAAGNGGPGISNSITGSAVFYAGGGGGSIESSGTAGTGGTGGGGNGCNTGDCTGGSGTANTGGGGGGATLGGSGGTGGSGGSGVVVIAYKTGSFSHTGGDASGIDGAYTWVKFNSSGTLILDEVTLLTDLVSYWKLDESSGNAIDSHGTNHLTDMNTVGAATGKINGGRDFVPANTEYFTLAHNSSLALETSFSFQAWVKLDDINNYRVITAKVSPTIYEYIFSYWDSPGRFTLELYSTDNDDYAVVHDTFGTKSTGVWYLVHAWYDYAAGQIGISVNAGTPNTAAFAFPVSGNTQPFSLGASLDGGSGTPVYPWDGLIDEVSFWKRVLSADERTELYNGGDGLPYPFTVVVDLETLLMRVHG
jgi:hypothetical protein